jgi:hypothetical protein
MHGLSRDLRITQKACTYQEYWHNLQAALQFSSMNCFVFSHSPKPNGTYSVRHHKDSDNRPARLTAGSLHNKIGYSGVRCYLPVFAQ